MNPDLWSQNIHSFSHLWIEFAACKQIRHLSVYLYSQNYISDDVWNHFVLVMVTILLRFSLRLYDFQTSSTFLSLCKSSFSFFFPSLSSNHHLHVRSHPHIISKVWSVRNMIRMYGRWKLKVWGERIIYVEK